MTKVIKSKIWQNASEKLDMSQQIKVTIFFFQKYHVDESIGLWGSQIVSM